jgi:hypothetical protein
MTYPTIAGNAKSLGEIFNLDRDDFTSRKGVLSSSGEAQIDSVSCSIIFSQQFTV